MMPQRRTCKVISTSFRGRGRPRALDILRLAYALERDTDPGAPCDTVVVNNGSRWPKAIGYLDSIAGSATCAGTLKVLHRDDFGGSCGAFHAAYEAFRGGYDYWLFTEDHVLLNAPGYLACLIDRFDAQPGTGFVAVNGLTETSPRYARGAIGLTHASVLEAVHRTWGSLPHRRQHEEQDPIELVFWGEVLFTNLISRMGYALMDGSDLPLAPSRDDCRQLVTRLREERATASLVRRCLERAASVLEEWSEREPGRI
jgi:hypothetical protein